MSSAGSDVPAPRVSRFAEFLTGFAQSDWSNFGPRTISEPEPDIPTVTEREMKIYNEASAFEGAAVVSVIERADEDEGAQQKVLEITMEDGVTMTLELDSGEKRLNELGYRQRLKRVLTFPELYGVGIAYMSVFAGIAPQYAFALSNGGPAGVIWYWWITAFFVHLIGLSMAEISSSFPTAGSLYFWAASLAGPQYGPIAAFITGWLEFIGLAVGMSSVSYNGALFIQVLVLMWTGGGFDTNAVLLDKYAVLGISLGIIIICACINSCSIKVVAGVLSFSAIWQVGGVIALIIALPLVSTTLQPASWVFGNTDVTATSPSASYNFIVCLLMSQYSLYGYDGVAHLAEETERSDHTAPAAILSTLFTATLLEWGLLLALTFSIQDLSDLFDPMTATGALQPTVQIIWDAFYNRYGSGVGAIIFTAIMFSSFFFGCISGQLGASRVAYALSRDNGFPLSSLWSRLTNYRVPVYALWMSVFIGICFVIPVISTAYIFYALTSIATVGWLAAYSIPIFFRLIQPEDQFKPGPFYMAKYIGVWGGKMVHGVAFLWVHYTCVVFMLPYVFPVSWENFNYAPFAIVAWTIFFIMWWFLQARFWFKGPIRELEEEGEEEDAMMAHDEGTAYMSVEEQQALKRSENKQE